MRRRTPPRNRPLTPRCHRRRRRAAAALAPSTAADAPVADEWPPGPPVVVPPPPPVPGTGLGGAGGLARASAWHSLDGLKTALIVLFVAGGVVAIATFATALNRISAIDDFDRGAGSINALRDADDAVGAASAVQSVVLIATIVVFIIWQFRCAKNVEALGRESAKFGPGWSIGGWFIPLANFVIPVMIFQGFWRATAPGTRPGSAWTDGKGSALVGWWWGLFLVSNISGFSFGEDQTRNADPVSRHVRRGRLGAPGRRRRARDPRRRPAHPPLQRAARRALGSGHRLAPPALGRPRAFAVENHA